MNIHDENCLCQSCDSEREFNAMMSDGIPPAPALTVRARIWAYVREAFVWAAVVGSVLLMVRCS